MSTVPGSDAWRDAGLVPVEEAPLRLTDVDESDVPDPRDAEEYAPPFPRADRDGSAEEADVVEQSAEVPLDEEPDA
ncbi:conserved hypothetical protein [Cellulomonas flavigena DSM 20109]|uniref:Uncharacterized protein n=1 Tax=Cellulomonas flavigena (strain ATCC 482 / DSM 20109 / BCRC 11376 / JCM 18109 / NBRC 3775 / NCIMB 8073 / NRS 134) TaxID=446466 RepID=D5UKW4_CELFN|nr:hypothetical protein [Cellulomonas flavigena]ADG73932.1 conserved hypothetical protein [Cellulomonas flavigena DSM 20109]